MLVSKGGNLSRSLQHLIAGFSLIILINELSKAGRLKSLPQKNVTKFAGHRTAFPTDVDL